MQGSADVPAGFDFVLKRFIGIIPRCGMTLVCKIMLSGKSCVENAPFSVVMVLFYVVE